MASLRDVCAFLETTLDLKAFEDSSDNGLQIEGVSEILRIGLAVDACQSAALEAKKRKCEFLLVHHGLLWSKSVRLTGANLAIFKAFLDARLSLFAAHLPLDAHERYGNNFALAGQLGLTDLGSAVEHRGRKIGCIGTNAKKQPLEYFAKRLEELPGAVMKVFPFGPPVPRRVCVVSGGAAGEVGKYEQEGFDTFISGEPSQFTYHFAKDHEVNIIFAGHYATETVGVQKLGEALAAKFKVETTFIDLPTGI